MQLHSSALRADAGVSRAATPRRVAAKSLVSAPLPCQRVGIRPVQALAHPSDTNSGESQPQGSTPLDSEGDVYVYDPNPLTEGIEKHIVSVFVADETGLINRVAGVFARRGVNIESLAVGLNIDRALFTIAVNDTPGQVANVVKQLSKLVKVRYVEDITKVRRVERELMLLKVRAPAGPARTEVLQLGEIFRARPVDVAERCLTLAVSGDPGKMVAFQRSMAKFGIMEVVRTGRVTLKRGEELLEPVEYAAGAARRVRMSRFVNQGVMLPPADLGGLSEEEAEELDEDIAGSLAMSEDALLSNDVYGDESDARGVWEVSNFINVDFDANSDNIFEPHTLCIDVSDAPGVLNMVTGVIARRGYNIQSLAVGPSETVGCSRITCVIPGEPEGVSNLLKQLRKLVIVQEVNDLTGQPLVARELMMIKVRCTAAQRTELQTLCQIFRGQICDVSPTTITIESVGNEDKMKALFEALEDYGILETARTGSVSCLRESGVDTKWLDSRQISNYL